MKPIKMLGLAAMAALVAMAFVGISSAMADTTALCSEDPGEGPHEVCPEGQSVTHFHETSVGKAILLTSPKVECNVLFLGEVTPPENDLAFFLMIEGNFTYSSCTSGCTVTEQSESSVVVVRKVAHEAAQVLGEGEVHVNCVGINCYYNGVGLEGAAKGPLLSTQANGEVSIENQNVNKVKGIFCPSGGKLDIVTTPLSATYITE